MHRRNRWVLAAAFGAALVGGVVPAVGTLRQRAFIDKKEQYFAAAREAIRSGADSLPQADFNLAELLGSEEEGGEPGQSGERDHAMLRQLANEADLGYRTPEFTRQLLEVAAQERRKWIEGDLPANPSASSPGTRSWVSLGPRWARSQFNGTYYTAADTGRVNVLVPHPVDTKRVYIGTSGGGIWRTTDITTAEPDWTPITESLGSLAVGGMDISSAAPNRIYVGLGDSFDQKAGVVAYSDDDGVTWSAAIPLQAAAHPAGGPAPIAQSVRAVKIDPTNPNRVFVTTDVGLFMATDGTTFNIVDLPNTAAFGPTQEATWSVAYLGSTDAGATSHWLVSGLYACPDSTPPTAGIAVNSGCMRGGSPVGGNLGDVWVSHDSGATWSSIREAGGLPTAWTGSPGTDFARLILATATPAADPTQTVVFGLAGNQAEASSTTIGIAKSTNGGASWAVAVAATATTPLINRTSSTSGSACPNMNLAGGQAWYDLAIAVDPTNSNNVLAAGNLCGARTKDGGVSWELVSHWLPSSGLALTSNGTGNLPYVHADWHGITIAVIAGKVMALAGSDGGIFTTRNLFDDVPGTRVDWRFPDYGLVTHLPYAFGTGDPAMGNHHLLWAGLQDNGTRWRLSGDENFVFDIHLQVFDQIIGGDGFGGSVASDSRGANAVYWASVQGSRRFCTPRTRDCSRSTRYEGSVELGNWTAQNNNIGDSEPFFMRYSTLYDDASSIVSASTRNAWRITVNTSQQAVYTRLTPDPGFGVVAGATRNGRGAGIQASPYIHTVDGVPARIYGMPLTSGASMILIDKGGTNVELIKPPNIVRTTVDGIEYVPLNSHFVMVPPDPTLIGASPLDTNAVRKTWIVATTSPAVLPATVGRVFKTLDAGLTWQPFHGNGTGFDLPNTPVFAFRWDPSDKNTIWAGTEVGVYRSTDSGQTWARYGLGMPMARVYDLNISRNGGLVRTSVYGRGLWEIHPNSEAAAAPGLGDFDRDGAIDFFDVSALAVRLGRTPTTPPDPFDTLAPRYESSLDLTGSATTIEEADLTAELAKLGGQP